MRACAVCAPPLCLGDLLLPQVADEEHNDLEEGAAGLATRPRVQPRQVQSSKEQMRTKDDACNQVGGDPGTAPVSSPCNWPVIKCENNLQFICCLAWSLRATFHCCRCCCYYPAQASTLFSSVLKSDSQRAATLAATKLSGPPGSSQR